MKYRMKFPALWLPMTLAALLVVHAHAQNSSPQPAAKAKEELPFKASLTHTDKGELLYSMKFDGGSVLRLQATVENAFPEDNFLYTGSASSGRLPSFEIRNVRLAELARSIAFLSEGTLTVEVVPRDTTMPGNIWRISGPASSNPLSAVTMRAVAAPRLIGNPDRLKRWSQQVQDMEMERSAISARLTGREITNTVVKVLSDQKVFVLIGSEAGIAGIESMITASELFAAEENRRDQEEKIAEQARQAQGAVREEQAKKAADEEKARKNGR